MAIVDEYDCVLFDVDGVLLRGGQAIPGAAQTVERLRRTGHSCAFMTNNSTRTPAAVARMLTDAGIPCTAGDVVTSSIATAQLLERDGVRRVFALGEEGVRAALVEASIELVGLAPSGGGSDVIGASDRVDVVVVGLDLDFTYDRLRVASALVRGGVRFVATNTDATYPSQDGLTPGAGAIVAAVSAASGREPEVVGKPSAPLFLAAQQRCGGTRPLVVGDRLDTDIAGAAQLGWDSVLVLSGVATRRDVEDARLRPTYIAEDVAGIC